MLPCNMRYSMWCLFKLLFVCSSSKTKMSSRGISKGAFRYFFPLEMITIFITQKGRFRNIWNPPLATPLGKDRKTFSVMACINLQFYHRLFFVGNGCSFIVEERLQHRDVRVSGLWNLPNILFRQCLSRSNLLKRQLSLRTKNASSEICPFTIIR